MVYFLFVSLLSFENSMAQNGFSWSAWVGCVTGENDLKNYFELILNGGCHRVCQGSTVTYTITGTTASQITNTVWSVEGGTILSTPNSAQCVVRWSDSPVGSIGFTTTQITTNSPVVIQPLCVSLTKNPKANFAISPFIENTIVSDSYKVCNGQEVFFENLSTTNGGTPINSYHWDFGDGTSSASENTSHAYTIDGSYTIKLTIKNQCNCTATKSYKIIVGKMGVQINCASIVCLGQKTSYSVPDSYAVSCSVFNWTVVGGTIISSLPYTKKIDVLWDTINRDGFGYVTFDPTDCQADCYVASTLKIPIIIPKIEIVGETDLCAPTQIRYKLPQWPTTNFEWTLDNTEVPSARLIKTDQRNEILLDTGNQSGKVVLSCVYTNTLMNCGGKSGLLEIVIKQPAKVIGAARACVGTSEIYSESSGMPVTWTLKKLPNGPISNFNDTQALITFATPGNYSLIAKADLLCNPEPKLIKVTQNNTPVVTDFATPLTVCPGTPITYTYNNDVPNTRIVWEVIGGAIQGSNIGNSVQIMFGLPPASGPVYAIKLRRENIEEPSCTSGILTLVPTLPMPALDIKGASLLTPPSILPCGSSITSYQVAATDMDLYEWEILPPSAGNISFPNTNERWKIDVLWNQSSGTPAILKLRTKRCLLDYEKKLAVFIASPTVTVTTASTNICRGTSQVFSLSSNLTNFSGTILWDFGNGDTQTTNSNTTSYTYTNISIANTTFNVKATITNPNGCGGIVTTAPLPIQIKVAPVAIITPNNNVASATLTTLLALPLATRTLSATISTGYGATSSIKWFRDGELISPQPATMITPYVVTAFGVYHAIVTNALGCGSKTNNVAFLPNTGSTPNCTNITPTLTLTNTCGSITADVRNFGSPTSVEWTSGMGLPISLTNSRATFNTTQAGQYQVTYNATYTNNGIVCQKNISATILVPYIANLKYSISCGTDANYVVKLIDNSNYYPATPITNWVYKVRRTDVTPLPAYTTFTTAEIANGKILPAGQYMARIEIRKASSPAYPICIKEVPFTLVPKPFISFTKSSAITCPDEKVTFALTPAAINPNWKYEWTFGNGASNTFPNAFVTYASFGRYRVTLKVTDQNGCSYKTPEQIITVTNPVQLVVSSAQSITKCAGTPAIITFGGSTATTVYYKWMKGNSPAPGVNDVNPYTATTSGSYWLQTANATRCFKEVKGYTVSVLFIEIPKPVIQSMSQVCLNSPVPLQSNIGNNPSFQYIWRRNGVLITNAPTGADYPIAVGTYSYTLEVRAPLSDGTFCSKISAPFLVTVIPLPQITSVNFENSINPETETCSPYIVTLSATSNAQGTFTWSNGMSGESISVTTGGAYQVLFTSPSGCKATASIYVPKDLSSYMWIVPKGCYTFCGEKPTQQLLGPALREFANWAWLKDAVPSPAGTSAVKTKDILETGNYQLLLANEVCDYKSDPFIVTMVPCLNNCNWLSMNIISVTTYGTPYVYHDIVMTVANTSTIPVYANLTTSNADGFFFPSTIRVLPGTNNYTVSFVPNTSSNSSSVIVYLTLPSPNGSLCQVLDYANIGGGPTSSKEQQSVIEDSTSLEVAPNPTDTAVSIRFTLKKVSLTTSIELYDTTQRLLQRYQPKETLGNWDLDLQHMAAGMYIVVLKQNEVVLAQEFILKK